MNEKRIISAVRNFCENEYWREYFTEAPSDACKRYVALDFYYSDFLGEIPNYEEFKAEREKLKEKFKKADWKHLLKYSGHNPLRTYYRKMMESAIE